MRFSLLFLAAGCVSDNGASDAGAQGAEGGPCYANGTCNAGLVCVVPNKCVLPDASTTDTSTSDVLAEVGTDAGACPSTGLLAWWKGDNSPNDTQNFLPLVPKFSPSYANAHSNQGFLFDGTNYLEGSGANAQLPGLKAVTIEAWIQPANLSGPITIFSRRSSGASPPGFAFYINTGKLTFVSGTAVITANTTLAVNVTHHVAVTCNATGVKLYLDGAVDGSGAGATIADDPIDALVGASWAPALTTANDFAGWIDELAIYSKVLTDADIATLMGGGTKCN